MDPGFEIGGCPKCARKCAKVFFQCHTHFQVHNQVWAPWNCDTIINNHEVVENYNFEALWWRVQREIHFGVHARIPKNEPPSINQHMMAD